MKKTFRLALPVVSLSLLMASSLALNAQQGPPPQGYQQGPGPGGPQGPWDAPPSEYSDVARHGFHDGIEAARMDMEARRPMDPHRSPYFGHPPAPRRFRDDYRNAFLRGYDVAVRHNHEGPPPAGYYPH